MKPLKSFALFLGAGALILMNTLAAQAQAANLEASSDELAVYAAVTDSLSKVDKATKLLIADKTSTFACDESNCNKLSVGGCNGLRDSNETPSSRIAIVLRDLPVLKENTAAEFERVNQQCASIKHRIPSQSDYYLFNDLEIPKTWRYSFLVYFSRVGFNFDHTQALLNVGLFSATDANQSKGYYLALQKSDRKWLLGGTSAVWKLMP
jgi:hypothetical protein